MVDITDTETFGVSIKENIIMRNLFLYIYQRLTEVRIIIVMLNRVDVSNSLH